MAEVTKKDLEQLEQRLDKKFQRRTGILYEKFQTDLDTLVDGWNDTKQKVDSTFKMVGEMKEELTDVKTDVSVLKTDVSVLKSDMKTVKSDVKILKSDSNIMKSDISIIKNDLKQKVDRDEFVALEQRVMILENKFKKV